MSAELPPDDDVLEHALLESLFYNEMAMMDQWSSDAVPVTTGESSDPEKEILDNFGVTAAAAAMNPTIVPPPTNQPIPNPLANQQQAIQNTAAAFVQPPPVASSSIVPAAPPAVQSFALPSSGIKHNVLVPPATPAVAAAAPPQQKIEQLPPQQQQQPVSITAPKDRPKLVGQFATLAERLGITIPAELLTRLNSNEANATPTATASPTPAAAAPPPPAAKRAAPPAPQVRRRKKPRLHECERRLAELQAENERLKRHLDLVSNRSRQTEVERVAAETKMRQLLSEGAPDSELQPLLHSFQEMYSDYGKKRFEELEFHLEQLQRLAKPADFTKMGLWTLSGQSNNPRHSISSLLLNELSITPPQSRKIMEQREKIRTVCENLKESLALLGKLRSLCELKTKLFHDRMTKVRELLTPQQVVRLVLWINENSPTLQTVCPGWQSEQFQKTVPKTLNKVAAAATKQPQPSRPHQESSSSGSGSE